MSFGLIVRGCRRGPAPRDVGHGDGRGEGRVGDVEHGGALRLRCAAAAGRSSPSRTAIPGGGRRIHHGGRDAGHDDGRGEVRGGKTAQGHIYEELNLINLIILVGWCGCML